MNFEVGEIAIIAYCVTDETWRGLEVEVIDPHIRLHSCTDHRFHEGRLVRDPRSGWPRVVLPDQLRKKEPPSDGRQVVRWADCPWHPKSIAV